MKYKVNVETITTYEVLVEAESEDEAEQKALDMEYSDMRELDETVEAIVVEES